MGSQVKVLVKQIEKVLHNLDSGVYSTVKANTELRYIVAELNDVDLTICSIILNSFFLECMSNKVPKNTARYSLLRERIKNFYSSSDMDFFYFIKSSFQAAFASKLLIEQKSKRVTSTNRLKVSTESMFQLTTQILQLDCNQQLILFSAIADCNFSALSSIGKYCLNLLITKFAVFLKDKNYLEKFEESEIASLSMPPITSLTGTISSLLLHKKVLCNVYLTPKLLHFFNLSTDNYYKHQFVTTKFSTEKSDCNMHSLYRANILETELQHTNKLLSQPCKGDVYTFSVVSRSKPPKTISVETIIQYFRVLKINGVSESEIISIILGLLDTTNRLNTNIDELLQNTLNLSFDLLKRDRSEYKHLDLEAKSCEPRVTVVEDLWNPEVFVKAIMKLKQGNGLFNTKLLIQQLDRDVFAAFNDYKGLDWLFCVLSELNVKDKSVDTASMLNYSWENQNAQIELLKYILRDPSEVKSKPFPTLKSLEMLSHKEFFHVLLEQSTWGNFKETRKLFIHLLELKQDVLSKILQQLIAGTDHIEPNLQKEFDVFSTRVGERFLPLMWDILGYMISNTVKEKNFDLLRKCWSVGGKEFLIKFLYRKYCESRHMLVVILTILKSSNTALNYVASLKIVNEKVLFFVLDFVSNAFPLTGEDERTVERWLRNKLERENTAVKKIKFISSTTMFLTKVLSKQDKSTTNIVLITFYVDNLTTALQSLANASDYKKDISSTLEVLQKLKISANKDKEVSQKASINLKQVSNDLKTKDKDAIHKAHDLYAVLITKRKYIKEIAKLLKNLKESKQNLDIEVYSHFVNICLDVITNIDKKDPADARTVCLLITVLITNNLLYKSDLHYILRLIQQGLENNAETLSYGSAKLMLEQMKSVLMKFKVFVAELLKSQKLRLEEPALCRELASYLERDREVGSKDIAINQKRMGMKELRYFLLKLDKEIENAQSLTIRGKESDIEYKNLCEKIDELVKVSPVANTKLETDPGLQDRIIFLINNLSKTNLIEKSKIIKAEIGQNTALLQWLASYLVSNIITRQANFHLMYVEFLKLLNIRSIEKEILQNSLKAIRKVLKSQTLVSNSNERTMLKNLGSWLGLITLRESKPLLKDSCNLKALIVDGYERGWLIALLPFAVKIIEKGKVFKNRERNSETYKFNVFHKQNPWIRSIFRLFAELYSVRDLKLNLKFEIEMVCNELGYKLKDIEPSSILLNSRKPVYENNPDFNIKDVSKIHLKQRLQDSELSQKLSFLKGQRARLENQHLGNKHIQRSRANVRDASASETVTGPSDLIKFVVFDTTLKLFSSHPELKRLVVVAVDKAIKETLKQSAERVCGIACITCRQLIRKDFPLEWDEEKIKSVARKTVAALVLSLLRATCKGQILNSLHSSLKAVFDMASQKNPDLALIDKENAIKQCTKQNYEIVLKAAQNIALEQSSLEILRLLEPITSARLIQRTQKGKKFVDTKAYERQLQLPDILRPFPTISGINNSFLKVYSDFSYFLNKRNSSNSINAQKNSSITLSMAADEWKRIIGKIDTIVEECVKSRAVSQPTINEVSAYIKKVTAIGSSIAVGVRNKNEAAAMFAQRMFKRVLVVGALNASKAPAEKFRAQVQIALLEAFIGLCEEINIRSRLSEWVFTQNIDGRVNPVVVVSLLRAKVLDFQDFDLLLAQKIRTEPSLYVQMTIDLVRNCVLSQPFMKLTDFRNALEVLHSLDLNQKRTNRIMFSKLPAFMEEIRSRRKSSSNIGAKKYPRENLSKLFMKRLKLAEKKKDCIPGMFIRSQEPSALRKQVAKFLHAWMRLYNDTEANNSSLQKILVPGGHQAKYKAFLTSLQQHRALADEQTTERFFRLCTELVVESALTNTRISYVDEQPLVLSYAAIDGFSKLVLLLVKYAKIPAKERLIIKVFTIVANTFLLEVSNRITKNVSETIDQRPYFRLYLKLLEDLTDLYDYEQQTLGRAAKFNVVMKCTEILHTKLAPKVAPSFAFAWLRLISHPKVFSFLLEHLQGETEQETARLITVLFMDLISFLRQFLLDAFDLSEVTYSVKQVFFGTLKLFVVLLHDRPGFLSEQCWNFVQQIPHSWQQIKNVILSAAPPGTKIPSPALSCLQFPRLRQNPSYSFNGISSSTLDWFEKFCTKPEMLNASTDSFLSILNAKSANSGTSDERYNLKIIAEVITIYHKKIESLVYNTFEKENTIEAIVENSKYFIFLRTLLNLIDSEGKYYVLSQISYHLRYPGLETTIFANTLSLLFQVDTEGVIPEQISRVIVERLIVHKPHPWGLLSFFIQLVENKTFDFWNSGFVTSSEDTKSLFTSVSTSLLKSVNQRNVEVRQRQ